MPYLCFQDWGQTRTHKWSVDDNSKNVYMLPLLSPSIIYLHFINLLTHLFLSFICFCIIQENHRCWTKLLFGTSNRYEHQLSSCHFLGMKFTLGFRALGILYLALFDSMGHHISTTCLQTLVCQRLKSKLITIVWCSLWKQRAEKLNRITQDVNWLVDSAASS